MLKAIIFDMDGVLIDSYSAWFKRFNTALKHFKKKTITKEEFNKDVWAMSFNYTAKKYFQLPPEKIVDYFKEKFSEFENEISLYPNVRETLEKLKERKLVLTVATNSNQDTTKKILARLNIISLFDYIIGGDQVKEGKPDPEIILKTLKENSLKKDEVLFIGDTNWDKLAAEKASVKFIGLRTEGDIRIEKFEEILMLEEINKF